MGCRMTFYTVCFYALMYLLNLCYSRVLDYKEECKTICEKLGIERENCTSQEDALIDEVYKSRQEAENERARANNERERARKAEYEVGALNVTKNDAIERALKIFVMTHLCTKTELYVDLWSNGISSSGTTSPSPGTTLPPYVPHPEMDLSDQTRANYHKNAKKMNAILQNSKDPRVIFFKNEVKKLYPHFTDRDIADNFGLGVSLFHNCKHGAVSDDPKLVSLITIPGEVKKALRRWKSFADSVLLDIFEVFQQSIL